MPAPYTSHPASHKHPVAQPPLGLKKASRPSWLVMTLPFQEFSQLLFGSNLDFHPLLQPMEKFHSFITCPVPLVCTAWHSCSSYVHLLHAFVIFSTAHASLQLILTQVKQGSAISSVPSVEILRQKHLVLQGLWFYCVFIQRVKLFMRTLMSCCLQCACCFGVTGWHFWTEDEHYLHLKCTAFAEIRLKWSSMLPAVMHTLPEHMAFSHSQQAETPKQLKKLN